MTDDHVALRAAIERAEATLRATGYKIPDPPFVHPRLGTMALRESWDPTLLDPLRAPHTDEEAAVPQKNEYVVALALCAAVVSAVVLVAVLVILVVWLVPR